MKARRQILMMAAGFVGLVSAVASADDIQLKNGQKYAGTLSREGDKMIIHTTDGKTITARPEDIASVTLNDTLSPAEAATAEWTRIVQQIKNADNLKAIITLHQGFLDKFPDAPQAGDVKSSLDVYQKLSESDGVKFRGRWIPRTQIEVMVRQWKESATPATNLYQQKQYKDAMEAAKATLGDDTQNPDALTIAGLAAFHLKDVPTARAYFTSLITADPTSVLAENNLALVASVQKLPAEGLIHYGKALSINPENRLLLDNIQEAIAAYLTAGGSKDAMPYRVLASQFGPAEKKMEARMARKENGGLVRWGASWVTEAQRDKFNAYTDKAAVESRQLDAQNQKAQQVLSEIDTQLKEADADIENATQQLDYFDAQLALNPPDQRANATVLATERAGALENRLRAQVYKAAVQKERDDFIAATQDYLAQADKVKQALAADPGRSAKGYTGKQQLMEVSDAANPPSPSPVADPPTLPAVPELPAVVLTFRPAQRPAYAQLISPLPLPRAR